MDDDQYQEVIDALAEPERFEVLSEVPWFTAAICRVRTDRPDVSPFHWELEFPEVFFDEKGRLKNPGFHAVIGNPPYDVLSELESGHDLRPLRAIIDHDSVYQPSKGGKNNLYKLFICRSMEILTEGGNLGFITPLAILGDEQAVNIRRLIIDNGRFTAIEVFKQKDDSKRRVFPEAKLPTTVFLVRKGQRESKADERK